VLGVQSAERGQVVYLADPIPAAQALAMVPEGIEPRRILRFAAHCTSGCPNNDAAGDCTLIERMQAIPVRPENGHSTPRCHLRSDCQWWAQVGVEACRRCPAVVTIRTEDEFTELVADPATTRADLEAWIAKNPTASLAVGS